VGNIIRFPSDLVTAHDRRRLEAAAAGSAFNLEFRKNKQNVTVPYLVRCGHMRPSYRLRKSGGEWEAIDLTPEGGGIVAGRARRAEDLFLDLVKPPAA
jgi:hypothetical protein